MKKQYLLHLLLAQLIGFLGFSQTSELILPGSHRYMLDNPAAMGVDQQHHVFLGAYKKWYKLDSAPTTFYLASSSPFLSKGLGIGGILLYDQAGLLNTTRVGLNASIHLIPEGPHQVSIGASARYQTISFGAPNVDDVISGLNSSNINLGLAINYHHTISEKSFFNFYTYFTQFPASLQLVGETAGKKALDYGLTENMVVQANLRYEMSGGIALTPSFRFQAQPTQGYLSKTQIIDLAMGLSFADDRLNVRVGGRFGESLLLYGGVGIQLLKHVNAFVFMEPGGPFSPSAAFDAEITSSWKEKDNLKNPIANTGNESGTKDKSNTKIKINEQYYLAAEELKQRLITEGIDKAFHVESYANPVREEQVVQYRFSDRVDAIIDYFAHEDFLAQVPLQKLIRELNEVGADILKDKRNKGKKIKIHLIANVKKELTNKTFESFSGYPFDMDYWLNQTLKEKVRLNGGTKLTEEQLAAVKLHFLKENLIRLAPAIADLEIKFEINGTPSIGDNRHIYLGLIIEK